jgi:hypothetical protein
MKKMEQWRPALWVACRMCKYWVGRWAGSRCWRDDSALFKNAAFDTYCIGLAVGLWPTS